MKPNTITPGAATHLKHPKERLFLGLGRARPRRLLRFRTRHCSLRGRPPRVGLVVIGPAGIALVVVDNSLVEPPALARDGRTRRHETPHAVHVRADPLAGTRLVPTGRGTGARSPAAPAGPAFVLPDVADAHYAPARSTLEGVGTAGRRRGGERYEREEGE